MSNKQTFCLEDDLSASLMSISGLIQLIPKYGAYTNLKGYGSVWLRFNLSRFLLLLWFCLFVGVFFYVVAFFCYFKKKEVNILMVHDCTCTNIMIA